MNWYLAVLKQYATFGGRAQRSEYWYFLLFNLIFSAVLAVVDSLAGMGFLSGLYALAVLLPSLAVTVRRLHDTDHSGWWLLIALVPLVGILVLIYFMVSDSTPGENRFGANPKEGSEPS